MNLKPFLLFLTTTTFKKNVVQNSLPPLVFNYESKLKNGLGLDINCRLGESTKELQKKFPDLVFVGTEKNQKFVDIARKRHANLNFIEIDIEKKSEPLIDQFQIVQVSDYENFWEMVRKSYHLLDEDGLLIIKYKNKDLDQIHKILRKNKKKRIGNDLYEQVMLNEEENKILILK